MEVKLVVASGKNAGQIVPVASGRFFIGRAEDCHLRPNTDLISRHHCVITSEDGFVTIRDLGSRNGTYINDERIRGEEELSNGDGITIGPLKFKVEFGVEMTGPKKPKVENVQEAAARTVESASKEPPKDGDEFDLSNWLGNADAVNDTRAGSQTLVGTSSFGEDQDTTSIQSVPTDQPEEEQPKKKKPAKDNKTTRKDAAKKPGRLPSGLKKPKSADSQAAAADTLRHLFHRR